MESENSLHYRLGFKSASVVRAINNAGTTMLSPDVAILTPIAAVNHIVAALVRP